MQKICSNNHLKNGIVDQMEDSRISIAGRPNINEISKRNEAIANQERKSFYTVAGIIVLLIIAIIFLLYFFS